MKINFCGFNEETTVGEIRKRYSDEKNCKELSEYRKNKKVGVFDAIFAILLGGTSNKIPCVMNYIKTIYNKEKNDGSTMERNALTHTTEGHICSFPGSRCTAPVSTAVSRVFPIAV